ncbi:MAG: molecular chaperone TorD family protein [Desulfobacterales bacterium]
MNPTLASRPRHGEHYMNALFREDLYVLLSCLLVKPPDDDALIKLAALSWEGDILPSLSSALDTLRKTARCCRFDWIEREFENLFIGMGRGEIVPYASWYAEKLVMGTPLVRLRGDLAKMGISRHTNVFEPEDHAAALLETMALITRSQKISRPRQTAFFHRHIHPWLIRFFQDLQRAPSACFYRSVGSLGELFLQVENQYMKAL